MMQQSIRKTISSKWLQPLMLSPFVLGMLAGKAGADPIMLAQGPSLSQATLSAGYRIYRHEETRDFDAPTSYDRVVRDSGPAGPEQGPEEGIGSAPASIGGAAGLGGVTIDVRGQFLSTIRVSRAEDGSMKVGCEEAGRGYLVAGYK